MSFINPKTFATAAIIALLQVTNAAEGEYPKWVGTLVCGLLQEGSPQNEARETLVNRYCNPNNAQGVWSALVGQVNEQKSKFEQGYGKPFPTCDYVGSIKYGSYIDYYLYLKAEYADVPFKVTVIRRSDGEFITGVTYGIGVKEIPFLFGTVIKGNDSTPKKATAFVP